MIYYVCNNVVHTRAYLYVQDYITQAVYISEGYVKYIK
jgi:hypothetical protein